MNKQEKDNLNHPELVAYLDGELERNQRAEVERKLAESPEYRNELANLQRTWDVLDALPATRASQEFTQSTVELVALKTRNLENQSTSGARILRMGVLVILLIIPPIAAFSYGYWSKKEALTAPNRQLLKDLPIIENLSLYRSVSAELDVDQGIRFLELLNSKPSVFLNFELDFSEPTGVNLPSKSFTTNPTSLTLDSFSQEEMERLLLSQREFDRFAGSQPEKTDNLRRFHKILNEHPDSSQLKNLLIYWNSWLKNKGYYLGRDEIDRIKDATAEDRIVEIRRLEKEDFVEKWSRARGGPPAPQDVPLIKGFAKEKIEELSLEIIRQLDSSNNEQTKKLKEEVENAPTHHHGFAILMRARFRSRFPGGATVWSTFGSNEIEAFISALSAESKNKIAGLTMDLQMDVVQSWIVIAMFEIDDSDLQEFHDKGLTGNQRDSLKGLSSSEQKKAVQQAFRMALFQDISEFDDVSKLPSTGRGRQ